MLNLPKKLNAVSIKSTAAISHPSPLLFASFVFTLLHLIDGPVRPWPFGFSPCDT
jgi:hypothetical protein